MSGKWSRPARFPLHILPLDDEAIVYHAGSGNTHKLDELSLFIIDTLSPEPSDLQAITARVGARAGLEESQELSDAIELRLVELASNAIVEHHHSR